MRHNELEKLTAESFSETSLNIYQPTQLHLERFKACWLTDAQTSLTLNNCTLCPHCVSYLSENKQRLVPLTA